MPDWLPALVNAGRAFLAIGAIELFWVVTGWPSGVVAMTFVAVTILLLSPRGDLAPVGAIAFALGTAIAIPFAAIIKFAVLPGFQSFPALSVALGLYLIPVGFAIAYSRQPAVAAVLPAMAFNFLPILAPTNQMSYDTVQFYNSALAIFAGCGVAAVSFRLLPNLSTAFRARRLLTLSLLDLRRLATGPLPPTSDDWEDLMYGRLVVLPDKAEPIERAQLLAALSVGSELIRLRHAASLLALGQDLNAALSSVTQGNSTVARTYLARLDHQIASHFAAGPEASLAVRARASILSVSETLAEYASYFDAGVPA